MSRTEMALVEPEKAESETPIVEFGMIQFTGRDIGGKESEFDKIAVSRDGILRVLSIIDETQDVKAIRAILCGGKPSKSLSIQYSRGKGTAGRNSTVRLTIPNCPEQAWRSRVNGYVSPSLEGYTVYVHRLPFGQAHALFISKSPGFMKVVSPESLWDELNDNRFTTPIVKEWLPYIHQKLIDAELLEICLSYRCECGVLSATTADLDKIVTDGIRDGDIYIPEPGVIDVDFEVATP